MKQSPCFAKSKNERISLCGKSNSLTHNIQYVRCEDCKAIYSETITTKVETIQTNEEMDNLDKYAIEKQKNKSKAQLTKVNTKKQSSIISSLYPVAETVIKNLSWKYKAGIFAIIVIFILGVIKIIELTINIF